MNALADKVQKQGMPHSDMHSITWPHYSGNNHPYISSSGTPVGTKFTATYVGMVVEQSGHDMECISPCGIPCLCTLSASAFIERFLHQLDFFLEIFPYIILLVSHVTIQV